MLVSEPPVLWETSVIQFLLQAVAEATFNTLFTSCQRLLRGQEFFH
jgi:hypothetical protein